MKPFSVLATAVALLVCGILVQESAGQKTWEPPKFTPPKIKLPKIQNPFKKRQSANPIPTGERQQSMNSFPVEGRRPIIGERTRNWFREVDSRSRMFWQNAGRNISAFHEANKQRLRNTTSGFFKPFDFSSKSSPKEFLDRTRNTMGMQKDKSPSVSGMPRIKRGGTNQPKIRYQDR